MASSEEQAAIILKALTPAPGPLEYLAAAAGQVVGTSMSPELWIGVVLAVALARTFTRAIIGVLVGTLVVVAIRLASIGVNSNSGKMVIVTFAAILLWSSLGYLVRRLSDKL